MPCSGACAQQATTSAAPRLLDRVVVIGASASDGFGAGIRARIGKLTGVEPTDLRTVIETTIDPDPAVLVSYATRTMFLSPHATGADEVRHAMRERPTLVVGLDFLFWYVYGTTGVDDQPLRNESARLESLEVGLAELDRLLGPVDAENASRMGRTMLVVGEIPDLNDAHSSMLGEAQIPEPTTIVAANARLKEWVAQHPNRAVIVPMYTLTKDALSGQPTTFGGVAWTPAVDGALLQDDHLHPTFEGLVALWARSLESLRDGGAEIRADINLDPRVHRARIERELHEQVQATLDAQTPRSN
ncbi:MAG: hypothetical protein O2819_04250 [Planctomycetota bacterium]|nr:hypothetical protein [Planctomycetota bacterium]MDA1105925.1 hypothetical protein [Planctomycetota bacterium]